MDASIEPRAGSSAWYLEDVGDLATQALYVGALALMQFGTIARYIEEKRLPANPWLSLASITCMLVLSGVALGRLLMRWRLLAFLLARDAESARSSHES